MYVPTNKVVKVTYGDKLICKPERVDCSAVSPCSHEEADTRMLFHVAEAALQGCDTAIIRTVDTDVVVTCISLLPELGIEELWLSFGIGALHRHYVLYTG